MGLIATRGEEPKGPLPATRAGGPATVCAGARMGPVSVSEGVRAWRGCGSGPRWMERGRAGSPCRGDRARPRAGLLAAEGGEEVLLPEVELGDVRPRGVQ